MATNVHPSISPTLVPAEMRRTRTARSTSRRSPAVVGWSAFAATVVAVFVLTLALVLALTEVSVLAAIGFGLYCAFWLGIGFGTIVASAVVFGRES